MPLIGPIYPSSVYVSAVGNLNWNNPAGALFAGGSQAEMGLNSGIGSSNVTNFEAVLLTYGDIRRQSIVGVFFSGGQPTLVPSTGTPVLFTYETDLLAPMAAADVDNTLFGVTFVPHFTQTPPPNFTEGKDLIVTNFPFNFTFPVGTFITHAKVEFQASGLTSLQTSSGAFLDVDFFRLTLTYSNRPYATGLGTGTGIGTVSF